MQTQRVDFRYQASPSTITRHRLCLSQFGRYFIQVILLFLKFPSNLGNLFGAARGLSFAQFDLGFSHVVLFIMQFAFEFHYSLLHTRDLTDVAVVDTIGVCSTQRPFQSCHAVGIAILLRLQNLIFNGRTFMCAISRGRSREYCPQDEY
ncbi:hypothetical protein BK637_02935 [Pseudomonas chlororaphis]|nr:hypothetical protein BK637_02935 [Pseudomonas chlororaphis]